MKMKKLGTLLLTAAMMLGVAACGGDSRETTEQGNQKQEENGQESGQEDPGKEAGQSGDGEEIVLTYWAQWSENETQASVLKDAIARFEEAQAAINNVGK